METDDEVTPETEDDSPLEASEGAPDAGPTRVHFDPAERKPSTVVVLAVAGANGTDALDMASLNDIIDPDCLDGLFEPKRDGTPREGGHVTFPFAGHRVTVHSDGEVVLDPHRT